MIQSTFESFTIGLDNGASCAGLANIPAVTESQRSGEASRPLLVGLHGGVGTSAYWDLTSSKSAATKSEETGIPFVAIDRPCYGRSSSFLPLEEGHLFWSETAKWLHDFILPTLWSKFGHGCTAIVLNGHSMGCPPILELAALHSKDATPRYPLAGIILTGWEVELFNSAFPMAEQTPTWTKPTVEVKKLMMLSEDEYNGYDEATFRAFMEQNERQNVGMPLAEVEHAFKWFDGHDKATMDVKVPVLHGMGGRDWLWKASIENSEKFRQMFTQCERFDVVLYHEMPHALEWSRESDRWYGKFFTWASEVCLAFGK